MSLQQIPGHFIVSASATGGGSNCVYSTAVSATATASGQAFFTATQVPVSAYDQGSIITSKATGLMQNQNAWIYRFDFSSLTASQTLTDLEITLPNYNNNPGEMNVFLGVSQDRGTTSYMTIQTISSYLSAPGSHIIDAESVKYEARKQSGNGPYMAILIGAWWGNYMSIQPTADMSGMSVTGTALPYPDRPVMETASAYLSASGYEWVAPSGTGWVPTASATSHGQYNNGNVVGAYYVGTGTIGCSRRVLYSAMGWAIDNTAAFPKETYPSKAYSIGYATSNFAYGASGLVG